MPEVIDNVKVGLLIKKLLKERNMTQEQLANLLSVSKSAVSQNLNGKSSFDIQNLMKISEIFNISLDELISQKSGSERDVISEYERVTKKGIEELKRVQPSDLNIKEPDLYGKVLVEYIIAYGKVDMFKYLLNAGIELYNDFHHQAKKVLLEIITFMLEKNIDGAEAFIHHYARKYGSFDIDEDSYKKKIMLLLNESKRESLVKSLMTNKVSKQVKVLKYINCKKHLNVMTKNQWIENIAKFQLETVLTFFLESFDIYENYSMFIETFKNHNYRTGYHILLDRLKKKSLTKIEHRQMKVQAMVFKLIELNDLELFKKVLDKGLYTDINKIIYELVMHEKDTLYNYAMAQPTLPIEFSYVLHAAIRQGNIALLKQYIHKLNQSQKNYLLSEVQTYDYETLDFLLCEGAQFVSKYHNVDTYDKVNFYVSSRIKREEGMKEND